MLQDELLRRPLPIYYTAYLPSFRREAGRHAEMKGIIRVHEFNKVELVKFMSARIIAELEKLLLDAEAVLAGLDLPYRVLLLCTGEYGFRFGQDLPDIEAHAPGTQKWLEC